MKQNSVCGIIVTYNIGNDFYKCFNSVRDQVEKVIIVDNGSDEDTTSVLKNIKKNNNHVEVIYNKENLGIGHALNQGVELALENKARRVISLNTSGPFHTSLLKEASLALKERFKKETFHEMKIPVIFNTLGHEIEDQSIPEILEKQVMSPVYFEKSIRYMIDQGVDTIIEVGPGKVLSGFVRKIDRSIQLYQIEDMESLKKTVKALKGE